MKFFLTVLLAAFLGNLGSLYVMEEIRAYRARQAGAEAERKIAEQQRLRQEKGAQIREILRRGLNERGQLLPDEQESAAEGVNSGGGSMP